VPRAREPRRQNVGDPVHISSGFRSVSRNDGAGRRRPRWHAREAKTGKRGTMDGALCASGNNNVSATRDFDQPWASTAPLNLSDMAKVVL
jgi:hypothetical protein